MKSLNCIIETPGGYGVKYDYDPKLGTIELNKVLPIGLIFPFDFGFITGTIGEDGDPLDVMVVSEINSVPGCAMKCRIIGAITANQKERDGVSVRNDRYIGIPEVSFLYKDITEIDQLPDILLTQVEDFFINYNQQAGKVFEPLKRIKSEKALKAISKAQEMPEPNRLIQLLLPLFNNQKKAYPKSYYEKIKEKLIKEFGGVTTYTQAPALGVWKNSKRKLAEDKIIIFEVMVSKIDRSFWKAYKSALEEKFDQQSLTIRQNEIGLL